jgi:hypothetical protein
VHSKQGYAENELLRPTKNTEFASWYYSKLTPFFCQQPIIQMTKRPAVPYCQLVMETQRRWCKSQHGSNSMTSLVKTNRPFRTALELGDTNVLTYVLQVELPSKESSSYPKAKGTPLHEVGDTAAISQNVIHLYLEEFR